jgi:ATP-dependent helicase HrpB
VPLHGDLDANEQDAAVRPAPKRKVILSTNVAESSVTIEGVVAVIDSGLARVASQSPWSGFSRLRVEKISRASALQRSGRAGRTRPGRCLRLYTRADFEMRPDHATPEIRRLDLAETQLELAAAEADDVQWFEPPPPAHVEAAGELLRRLGAVDARGRLTEIGRAMLRFGVHPRAARLVVEGEQRGVLRDACLAAAILSEGDPRAASRARFGGRRVDALPSDDRPTERSDVIALVDAFREVEQVRFSDSALRAAGLDRGAIHTIARAASQLERACARRDPLAPRSRSTDRASGDSPVAPIESTGRAHPTASADGEVALLMALLAGYPDRVAKRVRPGGRQLALASGGSAELSESTVVRDAEWLVALDAEERTDASGARAGRTGTPLVRLASAIDPEWLLDLFPGDVSEARDVSWGADVERVITRERPSR